MKRLRVAVAALMTMVPALAPCAARAADKDARIEAPSEIGQEAFLFEIVRHLYRWYLDETDIERVATSDSFAFWVRGLNPALDPGDHSRLGEVVLPALGISVRVKMANYAIPELDTVVSNNTFKIVNVARGIPLEAQNYAEVKTDYARMKDYQVRTRNQVEFPDDALMMRLRLAVRQEVKKDAEQHAQRMPKGPQIVHISPLEPVANELWVFWETGRLLIHFTSDIDLSNPAVWDHEDLAVKLYDIDEQVVVSLNDVAGSNAFMTRDQVGRALYNCVVLGKRVELTPLEEADPKTP